MKNNYFTLIFVFISFFAFSQKGMIEGQLIDGDKNAVMFANVALYQSSDSTLLKVEASNETGVFRLQDVKPGNYFIVASYVGSGDIRKEGIEVTEGQQVNLGVLSFVPAAIEVETATITANRVMVEVKADRTVFNVDGTINSTGEDALQLMRKAPGVTVDNNDNISVLGRSGVIVYVDGKRLPLGGEDLSNYLKNLTADQIDRIDIISSPGARYEAEGNAGIIDIKLKRDKSHGANGSIRGTLTQGQYTRSNLSASANFRNKRMNIFGTAGAADGSSFNTINFLNFQNDLIMDETNFTERNWQNANIRVGADFFISDKQTIGALVSTNLSESGALGNNEISIGSFDFENFPQFQEGGIGLADITFDSILVANSVSENRNTNATFNINYRYDDRKKGRNLNIDLDYGTYRNDATRFLPNLYYTDEEQTEVTTEVNNWFDTPTQIDIYTFKTDYEDNLFDGKFGTGVKISKIISDNTFLVDDEITGVRAQNDTLSNLFEYDETVYAAYLTYSRKLGEKFGMSAGLRTELTDATGDLQAFVPALAEEPVELFYLRWFPNVGLTYQINRTNALSLNYGRRINRPDYNVLNPFNNRLSEISYQKGNPRLQPEIVNNFEIGYTLAYRYNFKLSYSKTLDQITRLIAPDPEGGDPRSNFITWENLSEQTVYNFNASIPHQFTKKWNAYMNFSFSNVQNQADYGNGAVVDVDVFTYNIYMQHTFTLPKGFKAEVSGWYSGPGVWGGVFLFESSWSLNFGLQRKFLDDKLNVRLAVNDVFYETGWDGYSDFDGLYGIGSGNWDSRFVSLSVGYNFGNQNVKSRKRKTGLEDEAGRIGN